MIFKKMGQASIEYATVIIVTTLAIVIVGPTVIRGVNAMFKVYGDNVQDSIDDPLFIADPPIDVDPVTCNMGPWKWPSSDCSETLCNGKHVFCPPGEYFKIREDKNGNPDCDECDETCVSTNDEICFETEASECGGPLFDEEGFPIIDPNNTDCDYGQRQTAFYNLGWTFNAGTNEYTHGRKINEEKSECIEDGSCIFTCIGLNAVDSDREMFCLIDNKNSNVDDNVNVPERMDVSLVDQCSYGNINKNDWCEKTCAPGYQLIVSETEGGQALECDMPQCPDDPTKWISMWDRNNDSILEEYIPSQFWHKGDGTPYNGALNHPQQQLGRGADNVFFLSYALRNGREIVGSYGETNLWSNYDYDSTRRVVPGQHYSLEILDQPSTTALNYTDVQYIWKGKWSGPVIENLNVTNRIEIIKNTEDVLIIQIYEPIKSDHNIQFILRDNSHNPVFIFGSTKPVRVDHFLHIVFTKTVPCDRELIRSRFFGNCDVGGKWGWANDTACPEGYEPVSSDFCPETLPRLNPQDYSRRNPEAKNYPNDNDISEYEFLASKVPAVENPDFRGTVPVTKEGDLGCATIGVRIDCEWIYKDLYNPNAYYADGEMCQPAYSCGKSQGGAEDVYCGSPCWTNDECCFYMCAPIQ